MTRYVLDTNIISEAVKEKPSPALMAWLGAQQDADLCIAAFTLAEIRRGLLDTPKGRRRNLLEAWFTGPEGPQALFAGRILPFDERAAMEWAQLMAEGRTKGHPRSALDMLIAAVAQANQCIVATRNERDFWGVDFINPVSD